MSTQVNLDKKWLAVASLTSIACAGFALYNYIQRKKLTKFEKLQRILLEEDDEEGIKPYQNFHFSLRNRKNSKGVTQIKRRNRSQLNRVFKICLTGGPCAGKTSALSYLSEKLEELGYKVILVPELATLTQVSRGMIYNQLSGEDLIKFEAEMMKMMIGLEDYFTEIAVLCKKPTVVICDRGIMDIKAFTTEEEWNILIEEQGTNITTLRDQRYDSVIHLVTAGNGASQFYHQQTSTTTTQDIDQAIQLDNKLISAWIGHPELTIVDNSQEGGFERKMQRALEAALKMLGHGVNVGIYKKYLLQDFSEEDFPKAQSYEKFQVEEYFLEHDEPNVENKLRKRGQHGNYTYMHNLRIPGKTPDKRIELRSQLSARQFRTLMNQLDTTRLQLVFNRYTFAWEHFAFIIDDIVNLPQRYTFLRLETDIDDPNKIVIPPFIKVQKDITYDLDYTTFNISKKNKWINNT